MPVLPDREFDLMRAAVFAEGNDGFGLVGVIGAKPRDVGELQ